MLTTQNGFPKASLWNAALISLILLLQTPQAFAASGDTLWTKTFGGTVPAAGHSVIQSMDGGFVVGGMIYSEDLSHTDCYLVKTDSNGNMIWERRYGGNSNEYISEVCQTNDGGYIFAGYTRSFGAGNEDFYLVKLNQFGDTVWTRTYGGVGSEMASSVQQTLDGGYIIAGKTQGTFGPAIKFLAVKTDAFGDTVWTGIYGGGFSIASAVKQTYDGGFILAGYNNGDAYLVRTDADGIQQWARSYGGVGAENAEDIAVTPDGGFIFVGWTESFGAGSYDQYLVRTDSLGNILYARTYGGGDWDDAFAVDLTDDGGSILTGWTMSYGAGNFDIYIVKVDAIGDTLWTRTYGMAGQDESYSIKQTSDGGYIVTGRLGAQNMWLLRLAGEPSLPSVSIDIIPDYYPIEVPAGGSFGYTGILQNNTGFALTTDVWIMLNVPGYGSFGPLKTLLDIPIEAGESIRGHINQYIPSYAPLGIYEYIAFCGEYPSAIVDSASIQFTVTPAKSEHFDDWAIYGWSFDSTYDQTEVFSITINPNLFNTQTNIAFYLPFTGRVLLEIYNLLGQKAAILSNETLSAGNHILPWDASQYSSGVYFCRLNFGEKSIVRRMTLLK